MALSINTCTILVDADFLSRLYQVAAIIYFLLFRSFNTVTYFWNAVLLITDEMRVMCVVKQHNTVFNNS